MSIGYSLSEPGYISRDLRACPFCKTMPAYRATFNLKHTWEHSARFHAQDLPPPMYVAAYT